MLLDRALTLVFRNFATCFLLVASLTLPLHVAVSYSHRDVIALREIHDDIARFPEGRRVRGVGAAELSAYRSSGPILVAVELVALPVLIAGAARIVERDREGELPTVLGAWAAGVRGWRALRPRRPGPIVAGAVLALALIVIGRATLLVLAEPLPDPVAWAGKAVAEGVSRALGAPFLLVPAALVSAGGPPR